MMAKQEEEDPSDGKPAATTATTTTTKTMKQGDRQEAPAKEEVQMTPQMLTLGRSGSDLRNDGESSGDYLYGAAAAAAAPHRAPTNNNNNNNDGDDGGLSSPPRGGGRNARGWWFSRWTALGPTDQDGGGGDFADGESKEVYREMLDPTSTSSPPPPVPSGTAGATRKTLAVHPSSPRRKVPPSSLAPSHRSKATYSSLLMVEHAAATISNGNSTTHPAEAASLAPTPEDALKQDCSFFFRSEDDDSNNNNGHRRYRYGLKAIRRHTNRNSDLFRYASAVDCVSPVVLQHYRARHAQLNHPDGDAASDRHRRDRHGSDDGDDGDGMVEAEDYDLQLIDGDGDNDNNNNNNYTESSCLHRHIVHSDSVAASSLLFEQDGRRLMRLPRDQVRLLADPDLEPGVLSVEQCRPPVPGPAARVAGGGDTAAATAGAAATATTSSSPDRGDPSSACWHQHPLRYVLTVDDGLYRQMVTEMSPQQTRCCGIWGCLRRDQERVDIRVAYALLTAILILLAINTLLERLQ